MKKKKNQNHANKINLVVVLVSVVIISLTLFNQFKILDKDTIPASFVYSNRSGFEIEKDQLTFGALTKDQGASRSITIFNKYNFPVKIKIKSSGEISNYVATSENNFVLQPAELKEITFSANPGENLTQYRRYSGEVVILTKRA